MTSRTIVLLSALGISAACAPASPRVAPAHKGAPHYAYGGAEGPAHWGSLSPAWTACDTGRSQSPIDLVRATREELPPLRFAYTAGPLDLTNNGHTVQATMRGRGSLSIGGQTWSLLQYHFHTPAEHEVGGRRPPLELHLVHLADQGVAVVGVFIEPGAHNKALEPIAANLPATPGQTIRASDSHDPASLLPPGWERGLGSWRYAGSLTTPPCTEGVRWQVLREPIRASPEQIERFRRVLHDNSRPVQPLNGRVIVTDQI